MTQNDTLVHLTLSDGGYREYRGRLGLAPVCGPCLQQFPRSTNTEGCSSCGPHAQDAGMKRVCRAPARMHKGTWMSVLQHTCTRGHGCLCCSMHTQGDMDVCVAAHMHMDVCVAAHMHKDVCAAARMHMDVCVAARIHMDVCVAANMHKGGMNVCVAARIHKGTWMSVLQHACTWTSVLQHACTWMSVLQHACTWMSVLQHTCTGIHASQHMLGAVGPVGTSMALL